MFYVWKMLKTNDDDDDPKDSNILLVFCCYCFRLASSSFYHKYFIKATEEEKNIMNMKYEWIPKINHSGKIKINDIFFVCFFCRKKTCNKNVNFINFFSNRGFSRFVFSIWFEIHMEIQWWWSNLSDFCV